MLSCTARILSPRISWDVYSRVWQELLTSWILLDPLCLSPSWPGWVSSLIYWWEQPGWPQIQNIFNSDIVRKRHKIPKCQTRCPCGLVSSHCNLSTIVSVDSLARGAQYQGLMDFDGTWCSIDPTLTNIVYISIPARFLFRFEIKLRPNCSVRLNNANDIS